MLAGTIRPALRQAAVLAALIVFLAFPAGRVLGFVADGMPSSGILAALALEFGADWGCGACRSTPPLRCSVVGAEPGAAGMNSDCAGGAGIYATATTLPRLWPVSMYRCASIRSASG